MKKVLYVFGIVLAVFLLQVNTIFSGDRLIFVEFFTSSTCYPCYLNNPTMTAFLNSQNTEKICAIGYHMNWPAPGNDPMHLYNQGDNNARRTYYGINSIPEARFDGLINVYPSYNQASLQAYYDLRTNILSSVTVIVRDSILPSDSVILKVLVYCETPLTNPTVSIHTALLEDSIHYSSPPGNNGEMDFHWVMRKMFPTGAGSVVTLAPGSRYYAEYRFKKDPIWNWNEVSYIAFVQDNVTKEILNAGKKTSNFTMLPYPAYKSVPQGTSGSGNYKIHIPYVASGYNSPVTLTAAVEPVTSGISVTFPGGNVVNSFPDSLQMQVTSNASVPTGTYKIVVTGTNASAKTHKTTVDYMVGKNFITVKTNPPNLNVNIDNILYSSTKIFDWNVGSQHNLQAISPQTGTATKYIFLNWSNGGDTTQNITVSSTVAEYTANYKTQYRLLMLTSPGGLPVTLTPGNNLYMDSGTVISGSVSPTQVSYNGKVYYFKRWMGSGTGSYTGSNTTFQAPLGSPITEIAVFDTTDIGISKLGDIIPTEYKIYQNYPNPFNPVTKIKFDVPSTGFVKLNVYNILGEEVAILFNGNMQPGRYETSFDASGLSSGVYFYKLHTESYSQILRMVVVK